VLIALAFGATAIYVAVGAFMSIPSSFLSGTAAAGGIGLFTNLHLGGFLGPTLFGVLRQRSEDYTTGMVAIAVGFVLAALIVIAVGRVLSPRAAVSVANATGGA